MILGDRKSGYGVGLSLILLILLGSLLLLGGCGGSDTVTEEGSLNLIDPKSGDSVLLKIERIDDGTEKGTVVQEISYVAREVEPANDSEDAFFMYVFDENKVLSSSGKMIREETDRSHLSQEEIQEFLRDYWDPYIGSKKDLGWDGREFVDFLDENGVSCETFMDMWQGSNMELDQFTESLRLIRASLYPLQGDNAIEDLYDFMVIMELSFKEFNDGAVASFGDIDSMMDWIRTSKTIFNSIVEDYSYWYLYKDDPSDPRLRVFFEVINGMSSSKKGDKGVKADDAIKAAQLGLDVAKFAWDIVKDNEPQIKANGAFTYIYLKGTDFSNYYGPKKNETEKYRVTFSLRNMGLPIPDIDLLNGAVFSFKGACTYDSKHVTKGGHYIPNVEFLVIDSWAKWPAKVNASVTASSPTNMAATPASSDIDPQMDLAVQYQMGIITFKTKSTKRFRVQGTKGISYID